MLRIRSFLVHPDPDSENRADIQYYFFLQIFALKMVLQTQLNISVADQVVKSYKLGDNKYSLVPSTYRRGCCEVLAEMNLQFGSATLQSVHQPNMHWLLD